MVHKSTIPNQGGGNGVTSFNTRTGAVTLTEADVATAIGAASDNKVLTWSGGALVSTYALNQNLQIVDSPTFDNLTLSGLTASEIVATDSSSDLVSLSTATYPSLTELSYVKGVTSAIQTQLNGKQSSGTYVTSIAVASSNGLAGSSSGGATPTLTISTSIAGVLLGNGTAISASNVTNDAQTKAAIVPNTIPSAGQLLVGNAGGTAYAAVSSSGDITIASTGAMTIGSNKVTYAKMQQASTVTLLGNPTGSPANIEEITLGSGLAFSGTTLTATGSGGTVTSVTFTGDGTVLSSTPSGAVTTSGTVTATLANAAAGTVLGNATSSSAAPTYTSTPQLGKAGTLGSITMGNATSGLLTLEPATGALGTVTVSIPAATDTLVNLAGTQTLSNKTFVAPALGTPASGVVTNLTGTAGINITGTAPAGTLSGTTLNSTVVSSSLTSVGALASGSLTTGFTAVAIAQGGTGQTSANAGFNALSPMTTGGDLIYGGASGAGTRLANGTAGYLLQANGTTLAPTWVTALANGITATTQAANDNSTKLATTAFVLANGAIVSQQTGASASVTNTSNYPTFLMCGAKFSYKPVRTGNILIISQGAIYGSNISVYQTVYGTGTAPNTGAAATGTPFGFLGSQNNAGQAVNITAFVSLSVGTTYWFDMQTSNESGTAVQVFGLVAIIIEL